MGLVFGSLLILVALVLGGVQILRIYNIYGTRENRLLFYAIVGVVGLVGIILAAWSLMKKETLSQESQKVEGARV